MYSSSINRKNDFNSVKATIFGQVVNSENEVSQTYH